LHHCFLVCLADSGTTGDEGSAGNVCGVGGRDCAGGDDIDRDHTVDGGSGSCAPVSGRGGWLALTGRQRGLQAETLAAVDAAGRQQDIMMF
jgi:hypothetical protein